MKTWLGHVLRTLDRAPSMSKLLENKLLSATEKCTNRMVNKEAKKHPPSIYDIGETVLIQNPSTGIKIVKKRYVLEGKILKRNVKNC